MNQGFAGRAASLNQAGLALAPFDEDVFGQAMYSLPWYARTRYQAFMTAPVLDKNSRQVVGVIELCRNGTALCMMVLKTHHNQCCAHRGR